MNKEQIRTTAKLLTEVACCTIEVHDKVTDDVRVCEAAVGYLAKDDPTLPEDFKKATNTVLQDKGSNYQTEQYDGKGDDLRNAIRLLDSLAKSLNTPAEEKETLNKAARLVADFYDVANRGSAYFLTEQACLLIQAQGKECEDAKICEQALRFITHDDAVQMQAFKDRTDATNHDPTADCDTEQYDGKKTDVRHAVADIMDYASIPDTPIDQHEVLKQAAEMIAEFYGMDEELLGAA
jgi:hypothetical protein